MIDNLRDRSVSCVNCIGSERTSCSLLLIALLRVMLHSRIGKNVLEADAATRVSQSLYVFLLRHWKFEGRSSWSLLGKSRLPEFRRSSCQGARLSFDRVTCSSETFGPMLEGEGCHSSAVVGVRGPLSPALVK